MAVIISSVHGKGGVGKSNVALCIASALHEDGSSVLVLDTDPQGTASTWAQQGEGPLVVGAPSIERLEQEISRLGASYDAVVIDGSAQLKGSTGAIIRLSDLVLVPVQPSPADLWATSPIVELIRERQEVVGSPAAGFVLSRATPGTNLTADTAEVLEQMGLPVLATLHQRVDFAEALLSGESPLTYAPKGKAAAEVQALYDAALETLSQHFQQTHE